VVCCITPTSSTTAATEPRRLESLIQYIYPSAPFAAGEDVTVKVLPSDPQTVLIFGKG
jgi:hypothetical protein